MCGIIGYIGQREVVPILLDGLRRLEYRGYDSAGVAVVKNGNIELRRSAGKLSRLEEVITKIRLEAFYINQLLPRIIDEQDARLRHDFLFNSGLDRFQVEELESEYFEMRAFPPQLLETIRAIVPEPQRAHS